VSSAGEIDLRRYYSSIIKFFFVAAPPELFGSRESTPTHHLHIC
jgi:hypothetical protein